MYKTSFLLSFAAFGSIFYDTADAAPTIVVDDSGNKGDYTTIQEALDNASPGDTIKILKHSTALGWQEEVVVTTSGITIVGEGKSEQVFHDEYSAFSMKTKKSSKSSKGSLMHHADIDYFFSEEFLYGKDDGCPVVILDGATEDRNWMDYEPKFLITVNATDVTIDNISTRHGGIVFGEESSGSQMVNSCVLGSHHDVIETIGSPEHITVDGNFFQGGKAESVDLSGNNHVVSNNVFSATDSGIFIRGDDGTISANVMLHCDDQCIKYHGNDGTITDNMLIYFQDAIEYNGNDAVITHNYIQNGDDGIELCGNHSVIQDNYFEGMDHEFIEIECNNDDDSISNGGFIERNILLSGYDDDAGILLVRAENFFIDGNEISFVNEDGIELHDSHNNIISNNKISRAGAAGDEVANETPSIVLSNSHDNKILANDIYYSVFAGIVNWQSNNNLYQDNYIYKCGDGGIVIMSGNFTEIEQNTIIETQGEGIAILGGIEARIVDNVVEDNRIDICTDSPQFVDSFEMKNDGHSGGLNQPCVVTQKYIDHEYTPMHY